MRRFWGGAVDRSCMSSTVNIGDELDYVGFDSHHLHIVTREGIKHPHQYKKPTSYGSWVVLVSIKDSE